MLNKKTEVRLFFAQSVDNFSIWAFLWITFVFEKRPEMAVFWFRLRGFLGGLRPDFDPFGVS